MENLLDLKNVLEAFIFSVMGLVLFGIGFFVFDKAAPGDFWHEIIEEHNTALGIMLGSFAIGIAIIVSAAIRG